MAFQAPMKWPAWMVGCLLILLAGVNGACEPRPQEPMVSPSGRYQLVQVLETQEGSRWFRFRVEDRQQREVYVSTEHWAARHRTEFYWDAQDRVWVYSGDVGISAWAPGPEGTWHALGDAERQALTPPEPIRKQLEKYAKPRSR